MYLVEKKIITSCDVLEIYDNTGNIVLSLDSSSQYNDGTSWSAPETLLPGPGQYTFKLINTCCGDTLQVVKTIDTIDMNFSFYDFVSNVGYDNTAGIEIQIGQIPPSNNYFIWDSINAPSFYIPTPGTANNYDTVFGPILNDTIHLPNNANKFKLGSFPLGTYYFRMGNSYCGIEDTFTIVVTNSDLINFSYNTQYVQKCEGLSQIHVLHNSTEDSRGSVTIRNQANQIVGFNYNMSSGDTAIATNLNSSSLYTLRYSRRNPVLELFALSGEAGVMYDTLLTPPQPFPVIDSITYNCTEGDSSWVFIHANGLNPIKYRHRLYGELSFGPYQYVDSFYLTNGNTFEFMLEDTCGNSSSTYIQGICTPSVVLPSTVIDFEATVKDCSNLLSWTSISENNSLGYRVERSFNLLNWENCCWIESQGNSNSPIDYSRRDDQILGSLQKHVYYRLTHIDVDGKEQLHGIRAVDISDCLNTAIRMYRNPTNGLSTIFSMVDGEAELIDTTGRSMGWFRLKKGENIRDMTALAPGVYTIKVDLITGAVYSYRFIKS